ncbi:MAG: hypothetical protein ACJA2Q_002493 [Pseudohongiellaceae bacterium]|jgi:hypothetical protein
MGEKWDFPLVERLPIKAIFTESIGLTWQRKAELLRLAWPYLTAIFIATAFTSQISGTTEQLIASLVITITGAPGIVSCHRVFLLRHDEVLQLSAIRWSQRETSYLRKALGLGFLMLLFLTPVLVGSYLLIFTGNFPSELTGLGIQPLILIIAFPGFYIVSRYSIILPATALDEIRSARWAWRMSSGNGWRLVALIAFTPIIFNSLLNRLLNLIGEFLIVNLFYASTLTVLTVFEVCLISLSYAWLVTNNNAEDNVAKTKE